MAQENEASKVRPLDKKGNSLLDNLFTAEIPMADNTCYFDNMTLDMARFLLDRGFVEPETGTYLAPKSGEFLTFIKGHKEGKWVLNGFVKTEGKSGIKIRLTGMESTCPISDKTAKEFLMKFLYANELRVDKDNYAYCTYD